MEINENIKLQDLYALPKLETVKDCLISGGSFFTDNAELTLAQLCGRTNWNIKDILFGFERITKKHSKVFSLYESNPGKENVRLTYLPSEKNAKDYYVILLAGGAYGAVCSMIEAYPTAAWLNKIGIDCFCLNYETASPKCFENGLLPAPLDDLAEAYRFIEANGLVSKPDKYVVCGFSAGGHTASLWGTRHLGAAKYGIPQAEALWLVYPLITAENIPDSPLKNYLCMGMFGKNYTLDIIRSFDASRNADGTYPKTYLVRALDDDTVGRKDGDDLKSALDGLNVPCVIEQHEAGGHGFGLGMDSPVFGWADRACEFTE